jgi:tetratricopeptide (TPR) repeat protein
MDLGIDPQGAAQIPEGRYLVRAVLDLPFWPPWRWTGRVVSRPVAFTVRKRGDTTASTLELERERFVESIDFYIQAKQFENAYKLAVQFRDREPKTIYSYLLLGDALNGLKRYQEALEAYDYALHLAALEHAYEPPEYLLMRKYEVERRVEGRQ